MQVVLTAYFQRSFELEQDGLREKYFPGLEAKAPYLALGQLHILAGSGTTNCKQNVQSVKSTSAIFTPLKMGELSCVKVEGI